MVGTIASHSASKSGIQAASSITTCPAKPCTVAAEAGSEMTRPPVDSSMISADSRTIRSAPAPADLTSGASWTALRSSSAAWRCDAETITVVSP
ncbi:MAG: hypothetical protein U1D55_00495 [Phycisphaerae bacterium]